MALTIKKFSIALLCLSLLVSSCATVVAQYDFDSGKVYFSMAFGSSCSIKEYKKQSLESRSGCNDALVCVSDNTAAPNRDTDSALPGETHKECADMLCNSFVYYAAGSCICTQRKSFYLRI